MVEKSLRLFPAHTRASFDHTDHTAKGKYFRLIIEEHQEYLSTSLDPGIYVSLDHNAQDSQSCLVPTLWMSSLELACLILLFFVSCV